MYHLECPSGIAGDMFLGACLDLGMPLEVLVEAVRALGLEGLELEHRRSQRGGITGSRFRVLVAGQPVEGPDPEEAVDAHRHPGHDHSGHDPHHRHEHSLHHAHPHAHDESQAGEAVPNTYRGIADLVEASELDAAVKVRALRMLRWVGEAEARVHGLSLDKVHFHELAAIDSIVDIVGAAAAIEALGAERVTCGTVVVGSGTVHTAHGLMPVPAPATALLLEGIPSLGGGTGELVTPTGALILKELVDEFGCQPLLVAEATGYGLGRKHLDDRSNSVRLVRGSPATKPLEDDDFVPIDVVEAQLDDVTGELVGFLIEQLLAQGALDAYSVPVLMKKSRPGVLVTAICRPEATRALAKLLIEQSSSLGCRVTRSQRMEADRFAVTVSTEYGPIDVKVGRLGERIISSKPEYEQASAQALRAGVSLTVVQRAAVRAFEQLPADRRARLLRGDASAVDSDD